MLAKQAWRLLSCPTSLCGKNFKARYCPKSDFLKAKLGNNPSYIWRSIFSSQDVVKEGCRKRVGNGLNTKIWGEPWLANSYHPYVETPSNEELVDVTVDALVKPGFEEWDEDIVRGMFEARDQEAILAIPLPKYPKEDSWFWAWDSKGMYSVKSGYNSLCVSNMQVMAPSITDWRFIWTLKIPPKVRNFIWRAMDGCLPVKVNLMARRIISESNCSLCNQADETIDHALIGCPVAQFVWAKAQVNASPGTTETLIKWWNRSRIMQVRSVMERCACLLWGIWGNRNHAKWKGQAKQPSFVIKQASFCQAEWQSTHISAAMVKGVHQEKWLKPQVGKWKCNVDAALFSGEKKIGFGCIIRDSTGSFVAAMQGSKPGSFSPMLAEAIGLREALSWLKDASYHSIIVETDSQIVSNAVNGEDIFYSSLGIIIDDCRAICKAINQCRVTFIRRSANVVAHSFARAARSVSGQRVFETVCPSFISDVIAADLNE